MLEGMETREWRDDEGSKEQRQEPAGPCHQMSFRELPNLQAEDLRSQFEMGKQCQGSRAKGLHGIATLEGATPHRFHLPPAALGAVQHEGN